MEEEEAKDLLDQVQKLELMERRTRELVEQRKQERATLELECAKMERQKKYLTDMLRENQEVAAREEAIEATKRPFSGKGNVLGDPVSPAPAAPVMPLPRATPVALDLNQPKGNVQVRLGDGGRLIVTLNHSHTIRDLKQEIRAKSSSEDPRDFLLVSIGAPPVKYENLQQTISDAGLISAAVLQRFL